MVKHEMNVPNGMNIENIVVKDIQGKALGEIVIPQSP